MKIGDVEVSDHAWDRWCQRYPPIVNLKNYDDALLETHLRTIYKRAKPEDMDPAGRVRRMIDNNAEGAHYLYDKGTRIRFVLNEERTSLVTIEEDKFYAKHESRPSKKHFR